MFEGVSITHKAGFIHKELERICLSGPKKTTRKRSRSPEPSSETDTAPPSSSKKAKAVEDPEEEQAEAEAEEAEEAEAELKADSLLSLSLPGLVSFRHWSSSSRGCGWDALQMARTIHVSLGSR